MMGLACGAGIHFMIGGGSLSALLPALLPGAARDEV